MMNLKKNLFRNGSKLRLGPRVVRILTEPELTGGTGMTHTLGLCPTQRAPARSDG